MTIYYYEARKRKTHAGLGGNAISKFSSGKLGLYHAIGKGSKFEKHPADWNAMHKQELCVGTTLTSKHRFFDLIKTDQVIDQTIVVVVDPAQFSLLSSSIHQVWAFKQGCSLETRPRYTPSTCYETFPKPEDKIFREEELASTYLSERRQIMAEQGIGLTQLYNQFHNPALQNAHITALREVQVKIDNAVRDAYGWTDLDLEHGFHEVGYLPANDNVRFTISESARIEVLKRLAALNRQRWEEEETAGLHKKGKK